MGFSTLNHPAFLGYPHFPSWKPPWLLHVTLPLKQLKRKDVTTLYPTTVGLIQWFCFGETSVSHENPEPRTHGFFLSLPRLKYPSHYPDWCQDSVWKGSKHRSFPRPKTEKMIGCEVRWRELPVHLQPYKNQNFWDTWIIVFFSICSLSKESKHAAGCHPI